MDEKDVEQAKGVLLAGVGWAFKAAPHPLLKAAVALLGVAGHLQLTLTAKKVPTAPAASPKPAEAVVDAEVVR
jgi:hypothetical protein